MLHRDTTDGVGLGEKARYHRTTQAVKFGELPFALVAFVFSLAKDRTVQIIVNEVFSTRVRYMLFDHALALIVFVAEGQIDIERVQIEIVGL